MVEYLDYSFFLPMRDIPEEREFAKHSIKAAVKQRPGELMILLDAPAAEDYKQSIRQIVQQNNYPLERLSLIEIPKDKSWHFQLSHIIWEGYKLAKYDRIFSTNNDSKVTNNILKGYDKIGTGGIAVYSFTLGLRLSNLSDLIRYIFYRYRVWMSDYVFAGNYWVYRPWYYDIVDEQQYKSLINGVDTYLTQRVNEVKKQYKVFTDKSIGVRCMTVQNEDYPWRQFQVGVWLGANQRMWASVNADLESERQRLSLSQKIQKARAHPNRIPGYIMYYAMKRPIKKIMNSPDRYVWVRTFIYQHPYMMKGYKWALKHQDHEVVKIARSMEQYEFYYQGGKYVKTIEGLPEIIPLHATGA